MAHKGRLTVVAQRNMHEDDEDEQDDDDFVVEELPDSSDDDEESESSVGQGDPWDLEILDDLEAEDSAGSDPVQQPKQLTNKNGRQTRQVRRCSIQPLPLGRETPQKTDASMLPPCLQYPLASAAGTASGSRPGSSTMLAAALDVMMPAEDAGRLSSPTTRSNRRHNPAMDVSAVDPSDPNEAVSKRTRSKHPLGPGQFDPTEFDRLLAEFDPDAELVMDDQMYASFLQALKDDNHAIPDDEEDDDDFDLDPADYLVDEEIDILEEERIAQLVQKDPQHRTHFNLRKRKGRRVSAAATQQQTPKRSRLGQPRHDTITAAAIAAGERVARTALRSHQPQLPTVPMIPATAAGLPATAELPAQQAPLPESLATADAVGSGAGNVPLHLMQPQHEVVKDADATTAAHISQDMAGPQQHQQQQHQQQLGHDHMQAEGPQQQVEPEAGVFPGSEQAATTVLPGDNMTQLTQQNTRPAEAGTGAASTETAAAPPAAAAAKGAKGVQAVPSFLASNVLQLHVHQLQQLYHQLYLHTQQLMQLYTLTAKDPDPQAQVISTNSVALLLELQARDFQGAIHLQGQQMAAMVQQSFAGQQHGWQPAVGDMRTVFDVAPMRLMPQLQNNLSALAEMSQPTFSLLAVAPNRQIAKDLPRQLSLIYGEVVDKAMSCCKPYFEPALWPKVFPKGRPNIWVPAEDDLLVLGIARAGESADRWSDIQQEFFPGRTASQIHTRYKNLVQRGLHRALVGAFDDKSEDLAELRKSVQRRLPFAMPRPSHCPLTVEEAEVVAATLGSWPRVTPKPLPPLREPVMLSPGPKRAAQPAVTQPTQPAVTQPTQPAVGQSTQSAVAQPTQHTQSAVTQPVQQPVAQPAQQPEIRPMQQPRITGGHQLPANVHQPAGNWVLPEGCSIIAARLIHSSDIPARPATPEQRSATGQLPAGVITGPGGHLLVTSPGGLVMTAAAADAGGHANKAQVQRSSAAQPSSTSTPVHVHSATAAASCPLPVHFVAHKVSVVTQEAPDKRPATSASSQMAPKDHNRSEPGVSLVGMQYVEPKLAGRHGVNRVGAESMSVFRPPAQSTAVAAEPPGQTANFDQQHTVDSHADMEVICMPDSDGDKSTATATDGDTPPGDQQEDTIDVSDDFLPSSGAVAATADADADAATARQPRNWSGRLPPTGTTRRKLPGGRKRKQVSLNSLAATSSADEAPAKGIPTAAAPPTSVIPPLSQPVPAAKPITAGVSQPWSALLSAYSVPGAPLVQVFSPDSPGLCSQDKTGDKANAVEQTDHDDQQELLQQPEQQGQQPQTVCGADTAQYDKQQELLWQLQGEHQHPQRSTGLTQPQECSGRQQQQQQQLASVIQQQQQQQQQQQHDSDPHYPMTIFCPGSTSGCAINKSPPAAANTRTSTRVQQSVPAQAPQPHLSRVNSATQPHLMGSAYTSSNSAADAHHRNFEPAAESADNDLDAADMEATTSVRMLGCSWMPMASDSMTNGSMPGNSASSQPLPALAYAAPHGNQPHSNQPQHSMQTSAPFTSWRVIGVSSVMAPLAPASTSLILGPTTGFTNPPPASSRHRLARSSITDSTAAPLLQPVGEYHTTGLQLHGVSNPSPQGVQSSHPRRSLFGGGGGGRAPANAGSSVYSASRAPAHNTPDLSSHAAVAAAHEGHDKLVDGHMPAGRGSQQPSAQAQQQRYTQWPAGVPGQYCHPSDSRPMASQQLPQSYAQYTETKPSHHPARLVASGTDQTMPHSNPGVLNLSSTNRRQRQGSQGKPHVQAVAGDSRRPQSSKQHEPRLQPAQRLLKSNDTAVVSPRYEGSSRLGALADLAEEIYHAEVNKAQSSSVQEVQQALMHQAGSNAGAGFSHSSQVAAATAAQMAAARSSVGHISTARRNADMVYSLPPSIVLRPAALP
eukprot:jgi/Chrzof1/5505/Cz16g05220.t1